MGRSVITMITKKMKTNEIRNRFLDFFKKNAHEVVPSSSLVPTNDPTLLFTNAGMVQFKDVFLGYEKRDYNRAVTSQRCVRAGGKHNDLENVGYTARHHTFFEMLGNFSFGDYFKQQAICFAWEFLTKELALPEEKLWVSVFEEDDETAQIWINQIGIPKERLIRIGAKDNFWSMGPTGPCGPCTEIFYDHGAQVQGGPPGSPDEDGDRYIEIWNLVFMQYNRLEDGTLELLPKPSVDTGMGLERIAAVMQQVHSNYEIDLFVNLIDSAAKVVGVANQGQQSLRVIADHIRSSSFLIIDGVTPSNEGRGYVLRRIIRRAIRHGNKLGCKTPFMHKLVAALVKEMREAYPELVKNQRLIEQALLQESGRFAQTLEQGIGILDKELAQTSLKQLSGAVAFKLYDTYGFPVDMTADIAREHDVEIDMQQFQQCMQQQREQARSASQFATQKQLAIMGSSETVFIGYEHLQGQSTILLIHRHGESLDKLHDKNEAIIVLDQSPFYAQSGGQIGDRGQITCGSAIFDVYDTQKLPNKAIVHYGRLSAGELAVGSKVETQVDAPRRLSIAANHSATHLLHSALKQVLGDHVQQKGSLVADQRLRFDFSHFKPMSLEETRQIELIVNTQIRDNTRVETKLMQLDQAKDLGAQALFGEKYESVVRVVGMASRSLELCGGTHVIRTGDIGLFKILSESGVAAGVRRIEAVTAQTAVVAVLDMELAVKQLAIKLKVSSESLDSKVLQLVSSNRQQAHELQALQSKLTHQYSDDLLSKAKQINGIKWLISETHALPVKQLRASVDQLKEKLQSGGVILINRLPEQKVNLLVGITTDLTKRYHAGQLVAKICTLLDGKGGGKSEFGQGGGFAADSDRLIEKIENLL